MTADEKLAAILAAVQTDPGNRGLARVPGDNLFTATAGDFQAACRSIAKHTAPQLAVVTGFFIPSSIPPAFETDGPLGACFLERAFAALRMPCLTVGEDQPNRAILAGFENKPRALFPTQATHVIALERAGPAADGKHYTMRGRDTTSYLELAGAVRHFFVDVAHVTIGIGDGGNEIGMGKIPHETVVKNIPNGDLIHCVVPTDHLIVAGVSNWGAYALAAGVFVLRGVTPPPDLFDPETELRILEVMVKEGPLVDGVTGKQTATVDGLSWDEYVKPLIRIREIVSV
jgi:D-glutamate cyclase